MNSLRNTYLVESIEKSDEFSQEEKVEILVNLYIASQDPHTVDLNGDPGIDFSECLADAFDWGSSPQGYGYWDRIWDRF